MAKVTMYRGVDPTDELDTVFAVRGDQMVRTFSSCEEWYTPESFGNFDDYIEVNDSDKSEITNVLDTFEILWEADL